MMLPYTYKTKEFDEYKKLYPSIDDKDIALAVLVHSVFPPKNDRQATEYTLGDFLDFDILDLDILDLDFLDQDNSSHMKELCSYVIPLEFLKGEHKTKTFDETDIARHDRKRRFIINELVIRIDSLFDEAKHTETPFKELFQKLIGRLEDKSIGNSRLDNLERLKVAENNKLFKFKEIAFNLKAQYEIQCEFQDLRFALNDLKSGAPNSLKKLQSMGYLQQLYETFHQVVAGKKNCSIESEPELLINYLDEIKKYVPAQCTAFNLRARISLIKDIEKEKSRINKSSLNKSVGSSKITVLESLKQSLLDTSKTVSQSYIEWTKLRTGNLAYDNKEIINIKRRRISTGTTAKSARNLEKSIKKYSVKEAVIKSLKRLINKSRIKHVLNNKALFAEKIKILDGLLQVIKASKDGLYKDKALEYLAEDSRLFKLATKRTGLADKQNTLASPASQNSEETKQLNKAFLDGNQPTTRTARKVRDLFRRM